METFIQEIPYRFKISGNLIKRLGEESISNKNIAVLELIRNAYDAGATKVNVELNNIDNTDASIVISDNGKGMSDTDIEAKWMTIATPHKSKIKKVKEGERLPVGEKGIGRLSSESLGHKATLTTKPKDEQFGYKIFFNWADYQKDEVLCNEIINKGGKFKKKKKECGSAIAIQNLKHNWNDIDVQKDLLRDIYLLHPPDKKPKNFNVNPTFHKNISDFKKIRKNFFSKATYYIKTRLTSGNVVAYDFKAINGKSKKGSIKLERKLSCGDAVFEMCFYYKSAKYLKNAVGIDMLPADMNDISNTLKDYSGIKLYRDNFRVKPYGEPKNDWIGLEAEAQNNTMCPRNDQIFGMVHISKTKNPKISDTTTREGVIFSDEFSDLIAFVKTSILKLFIDFRSEIETHKKKARKKITRGKTSQPTVPVTPSSLSKPINQKLIDVRGSYPQSFYYQLEQEINNCYASNYPNATFFLSRKLVENLIFNILEKKFHANVDLYYHPQANSHHKLSLLIANLYANRNSFKPNVAKYIEKFHTSVGSFRKEANSTAHNIFDYVSDKSDLSKHKINDLVQLLINIYSNI